MSARNFMVSMAALLALFLMATHPAAAQSFTSDRITVVAEGEGRDVILIPGMTSSPSAWRGTTAALPGYRYHYVQVKGFAGTPSEGNTEGPVSAPVAAEIARYIEEENLERPALVGHSMGGSIALMIAARRLELVSKVMVVDQLPYMGVVFGPPGATPEDIRALADVIRDQWIAAGTAGFEERVTTMAAAMVRNEAQRALVVADARASDNETVANSFHELIVTDLRPELSAIRAPVTVLYVTPAAAPVTDEQVDALYQASYAPLAGVNLVRVPESAHFIMSDNPGRFQAELRAFLGG